MLLWVVALLAVTLFPYNFHVESFSDRVTGLWETTTVSEVVSNVVLFIPLGALLYRVGRLRLPSGRVVLLCGITGALLSLAVEFLQVFVPPRDPTLVDAAANSSGTLLGALGFRRYGVHLEAALGWGRNSSVVRLSCLLATFTVLVLIFAGLLQHQTRLHGWSTEFPLQVGNERTGYRGWQGRLFAFELTDAGATADDVRRFADGQTYELPGHPIAHFVFDGAAPYRDKAGNLPALDWTAPTSLAADVGVQLRGEPWLQTAFTIPTLADRLVASNAFTIRVQCASDSVDQQGPARIVSNSIDFNRRNLTIGQDGDDLIVRIRTPHTGSNGSQPELVVPGIFADHGRRDILLTYDGATFRAAVAGSGKVHHIDLSPGSILGRKMTSLDIQTDDHRALDTVFFGVVSVIPALLIAWLSSTMRYRVYVGTAWVLVFPLLFDGTLAMVSGKALSWSTVGANTLVGLSVMMVCVVAEYSANRKRVTAHGS